MIVRYQEGYGRKYILWITPKQKFKFFIVDEFLLQWGRSFAELEHVFFFDYFDTPNTGERKICITTMSWIEAEELSGIFSDEGFKVKLPEELPSDASMDCKYFNPQRFDMDNTLDVGGFFTIKLFRRDLQKFLNLIDRLGKEHNYRTVYYHICENLNYLNKVILK